MTPDGTTVNYDSVNIISLVEEDGELKVLEAKNFSSDPEQSVRFQAEVAKILGTPVA
jgi:hypothetical protein